MKSADSHFVATSTTALAGAPSAGDHLQSTYRLWLFGHQFERRAPVWLDPYSFRHEAPQQANPAAWQLGVPFWPLVAAFGPVVACNVLVLLGFLAAGGFTLLWLRDLALPYGAALAGGLAFALAPYRVAQSGGHLLGLIAVLLPLALLAWERGRRGSRWWHGLAAAALASIPLSGQLHLALGAIPFFLLYALCRTRERLPLAEAGLAAALAVACGLLVHEATVAGSTVRGGRSLDEVRFYSADWLDFVSRDMRQGLEQFVFAGWALPLVALAGLGLLLWSRRWLLALALALGVAVPTLLAVGTTLPTYEYVWDALPPFRFPRVPERLLPIACLALAALAAFAVARLARVVPAALATALAAAVVGVDLRAEAGVFEAARGDEHNAAYAALPEHAPGGVLELPVFLPDRHYGSVYQYYALQSPRTRPASYSTVAPPEGDRVARYLERLNCGEWARGDRALLERLGVRYVVVHRRLFGTYLVPDLWAFAVQRLFRNGFRMVARDGDVAVFEAGPLRSAPALAPVARELPVFCQGWRAGRRSATHGAVWVHGTGTLQLELDASPPTRVRASVDGAELPPRVVSRGATIEVDLVTAGWHLVAFDAERPGLRLERAGFAAS